MACLVEPQVLLRVETRERERPRGERSIPRSLRESQYVLVPRPIRARQSRIRPLMQVDAVFYQRLSMILRIVIPSIRSKEAGLLFMHSSLLIFRTVISLYVAALDGRCVPTTLVFRELDIDLSFLRHQNRCFPCPCAASAVSIEYSQVAFGRYPRDMDEQLAQFRAEQALDRV